MLDTKDLLKHAERCCALADLSRMPPVSRRLRALAQRYIEQAQEIGRQTTPPHIEVLDAPGLVSDETPAAMLAEAADDRT
jgi:hypothetical protein